MALWENDQSSSLSEEEIPHILHRKAFEIRTFSDTGGSRKNTDFQVAVLCVTFLKNFLFRLNLYSVLSLYRDILWRTSHIGSVIRRLSFIRGCFCNKVQPRKKSKGKRHSNYNKLLSVLFFIRTYLLFTSGVVVIALILIFFGAKDYKKPTEITNNQFSFHPISEPALLMLNQYSAVRKYLCHSSFLFVNKFPFLCMSLEPDVSKPERQLFTSGATNWLSVSYFATLNARKKFQQYKLSSVSVSLRFIDFFALCGLFILSTVAPESGGQTKDVRKTLVQSVNTHLQPTKVMFLANNTCTTITETEDLVSPTQRNYLLLYCSFCRSVSRRYYGKKKINKKIRIQSLPQEIMGTEM